MSEMTRLAEPGALEPSRRAPKGGVRVPGVGVLFRNEVLKARHRMAFWVGFLFFLLIVFVQSFASFYRALETGNPAHFRLPDAWHSIVLGSGPMPGLFAAIVVVLLTASEWSWRTARQNVIDGLSKDQFFVAKVLSMVLVALVFLGGEIVLAGGLAAWNTSPSAFPFLGWSDLVMAAGALTLLLGYGSVALFSAFLVRSAGSAIGVFFIYAALIEHLLAAALGRQDWSEPLARYLPMRIFNGFYELAQYEPERRGVLARRFEQMGREPPEYFDTPVLFAVAAAWIAAFVAAAYGVHRKRDL